MCGHLVYSRSLAQYDPGHQNNNSTGILCIKFSNSLCPFPVRALTCDQAEIH